MDVVSQQRQKARMGGVSDESAATAPATAASAHSDGQDGSNVSNSRPRSAAATFFRRRRSRSVDEVVLSHQRKRQQTNPNVQRRRLLEEHYRVDRITNNPRKLIVLPGVPKHEEDWARDSHDFFNLVFLIPV